MRPPPILERCDRHHQDRSGSTEMDPGGYKCGSTAGLSFGVRRRFPSLVFLATCCDSLNLSFSFVSSRALISRPSPVSAMADLLLVFRHSRATQTCVHVSHRKNDKR